jgi:hypothetical protein
MIIRQPEEVLLKYVKAIEERRPKMIPPGDGAWALF